MQPDLKQEDLKLVFADDAGELEDPDATLISSMDEYGGEWGGFYVSGIPADHVLSKEDWETLSQMWEFYCAGEPANPPEWEWEYVQHANLGAYDVATFRSNDRGGTGIFIRHP